MIAMIAHVAKPGLSMEAKDLREAARALNDAYHDVLQLQQWATLAAQRAVDLKAARDRMRVGGRVRLLDLARVRAHSKMPQMIAHGRGARRKEGTDTFLCACCWAWQSLSGHWPSPGQNGARFASPGMRFVAGCAEIARLALKAEDRDPELLKAADAQLTPLTLSQDVRGENSRHATLRTRLARLKRPRAI
ncbi:hypothetical protein KPL78_07160 [Roseomonas sp. HJA6]|uniref:Uncharacterized protein n=2 Tax=Roseomonas alba TaxID=2846776 RepID=A0ABS7A5N0_9PROT|nr:hypothetical protein [Neoroseomonas alba]